MELTNHASLSEAACRALSEILPAPGTLMELVAWGGQQTPPLVLRETVALDEYTHEVLAPWRDSLWLVYSST
jgi:hypothetical protein